MSAAGAPDHTGRLVALAPDLHRFARHLGAEGADADDLVQETLLRAWAARARLQPDADPRPFCFAICANAWRDRWRKQQHAPDPLAAPDAHAAPEPAPAPAEKLDDLRERLPDEVWRAVQSLSPAYRAVLFLTAVQGMSGREVAEILDWPGGSVRSAYSRARAALRAAIRR